MMINKKTIQKNILAILFGFFGVFSVLVVTYLATIIIAPEANSLLVSVIMLGASCFLGGFATAATAANYKIHCSCIVTIMILIMFHSNAIINLTNISYPINYAEIFTIIISGVVGDIIGRSRKL